MDGKFDVELCKRQIETSLKFTGDKLVELALVKNRDSKSLKHMVRNFDYELGIVYDRKDEVDMAKMKKVRIEGFYCRCKGCEKTPEELTEYKVLAEECGYSSAEEAVRNEEGTFNPATGLFWCTSCYIKAGMPLGQA